MRFEIEFVRCADGKIVRRNTGQFANERDVEIYAISKRPDNADGFRILKDGLLLKTMSIQTEK